MSAYARFHCPSSSLSLKGLLKRTRKALWAGLFLALGVHILLTQLRGLSKAQKAAKPLTTQFVKRAPRLTKPLEMKKRPKPKRRRIQRQMVSVKAKRSQGQASVTVEAIQTLGGLARPHVDVSRAVGFQTTVIEPEAIAAIVEGTKEPSGKVDMSLEMMDVEALDTGRYQAMVIQDPTDKRNVRGYFHIAQAYVPSVAQANRTPRYGVYYDSPLVYPHVLQRLSEQVSKYTDIRCDVSKTYAIGSGEIFETPYLMVCTQVGFVLNGSEAEIVGSYLTQGGFVHASGPAIIDIPATFANRRLFKDGLITKGLKIGRDWDFEKLPNDHPLYHCFFDFDGAPPGWDNWGVTQGWVPRVNDYIEGITIDGRLIGILDFKNYVVCWAWLNPIDGPKRFPDGFPDGTRQSQFGVNIIVYVLTQEGSITKRVMDTVSY